MRCYKSQAESRTHTLHFYLICNERKEENHNQMYRYRVCLDITNYDKVDFLAMITYYIFENTFVTPFI